jgi:anti-sigma regulatory factor (Ser/Thr protein kinase)
MTFLFNYDYDIMIVSDFAHGQGLISQGQSNAMKEKHQQCNDGLKGGKLNLKICMDLMDDVVYSASSGASHKMLMYVFKR